MKLSHCRTRLSLPSTFAALLLFTFPHRGSGFFDFLRSSPLARAAVLLVVLLQPAAGATLLAAAVAYVTNSASNTVTVVDLDNGRIVAAIPVGKEPFGLAFSPDGTRAYVANAQSGELSVIDTTRHRLIQNIHLDSQLPVWVAVGPDGSYVYVTNERSNDVSVISAASHAVVARIPVGRGPAGIVISQDGRYAYVANEGTNNVSLIDLRLEQVIASIGVGAVPQGLAISPDRAWVYVANFGSDSISVIATANHQLAAVIPVAPTSERSRLHGPVAVAVSSDGKWLFTGNFKSGSVSVIDVARRSPVSLVPTGPETFAVAADTDGRRIYAVSSADRRISVIDAIRFNVGNRISFGDRAYKLAVLPALEGGLRERHVVFLVFMLTVIGLLSQIIRRPITPQKGILLAGIFILALGLRLTGLNWGIPQFDAATAQAVPNLRPSFHMDEDTFLWKLSRVRPRALDFYVSDFHWGTLQYYLIEGALLTAQLMGLVPVPWREAFLEYRPGQYAWLFVAGRATSAILGSCSVFLAFLIGKKLWSEQAGIWASLTLAVIPLHVVNSHYLTPDINMTFFLLLAFYFLVSGREKPNRSFFLGSGIAFGLAVAAKYNAVFLLPVFLLPHLLQRSQRWATKTWAYIGMVLGFAAGEPYAFTHGTEFYESVRRSFLGTINLPPGAAPLWYELLGLQLKNMALFGMGAPLALASLAAVLGYVYFRVFRISANSPAAAAGDLPDRASDVRFVSRILLFACILSFFVSVLLLRLPMLRYTLPVLVFAVIPAGHFLSFLARRRWGRVLAASLILATVFISFLQVKILTQEHTVNQASRWIERHVPPGASFIKGWPKIPVINPQRYSVTNFYTQNRIVDMREFFQRAPGEPFFPDYVLLDNFPTFIFPAEFLQALSRHYLLVAEFKRVPQFWKLTFPEWEAPHDWKYSHPEIRIYRKRSDSQK